jgi:hypothetical protein
MAEGYWLYWSAKLGSNSRQGPHLMHPQHQVNLVHREVRVVMGTGQMPKEQLKDCQSCNASLMKGPKQSQDSLSWSTKVCCRMEKR